MDFLRWHICVKLLVSLQYLARNLDTLETIYCTQLERQLVVVDEKNPNKLV